MLDEVRTGRVGSRVNTYMEGGGSGTVLPDKYHEKRKRKQQNIINEK